MKKISVIFIAALFLSACGGDVPGNGAPNPEENTSNDPPNTAGDGDCVVKRHGADFACWYRGCFQEEEVASSLDALRDIGGNALAIVPTWYQDSLSSSAVYEDPTRSATTEDIRAVMGLARERGFSILLKPHIDVKSGGSRLKINPDDLLAWQESYRSFILSFARLAEELDVETLSIGTELKKRSPDTSFWRSIIQEIRGVYTGELTYSANWDEYNLVQFWDLLDFVGIDFYFPLTDNKDAAAAEMEAALAPIASTLESFSDEAGRPFIFTEIGYRSVDGTNIKPYDYSADGPIDLEEQVDAYTAALATFEGADWLEGIFLWRWDIRLEGAEDDGYLIYDKPALDTLRQYWEGVSCE